ncbi:uncharacterized protein LOC118199488 [Stegodyphus dumicola]|uniref:uncharacterized protein LOC118199488 n=1 Tax=Stegodyphus dumicola TaxID=202533 RepID=UPI0015AAE575|nr:uncharacterized protein LOC118199488 [Stegodyphus dumicola]
MDFVVNGGVAERHIFNETGPLLCDDITNDLKLSVAKKASFESLSRASSKSSIYELVSEEVEDCSDVDFLKVGNRNEEDFVIVSEIEESDDCNSDNDMNASDKDDKSDGGLSDELYIIEDDDANDTLEVSNSASVKETQKTLSDGDDIEMDEIIAEFAKEEVKESNVIKFSDQEDEIDSILEDFAIADSPLSSPQKSDMILSAEVDKEVESILEAFSKADDSDDDDCYIVEEDDESEEDSSFVQSTEAAKNQTEHPNTKINNVQEKETSYSTSFKKKLENGKSDEVQLSSQQSENLSEVIKVSNSVNSGLESRCSKSETENEKEKVSNIKCISVSRTELLETNNSSKFDVAESLDVVSEIVTERKISAVCEQSNLESEETNSGTGLTLSMSGIGGNKSVAPDNKIMKSDASPSKQSSHAPVIINSRECPSDIGDYIHKNLHFNEDESFSVSAGALDTFASAFNVLLGMFHAIDTADHGDSYKAYCNFDGNKNLHSSRKIGESVSEGREVFGAEINSSRADNVCRDAKGRFSKYERKCEVQNSLKASGMCVDKEDVPNKSSSLTNSVESCSDLSLAAMSLSRSYLLQHSQEKLLNSELASDVVEAKRLKLDLSLQDRELQRDSLKETDGDEEELSVKPTNTSQSKMSVLCLESDSDSLKILEGINSCEEDKKRKLNNSDIVKNDAMNKKLKKDNFDNVIINGSSEENEDMKNSKSKDISDDAVLDFKNKERVYQVIPPESCTEIETKKKWLEKIAASICGESVMEYFPKQFILEVKNVKELEKKNHILSQDLKLCQEKANDFMSSQRAVFKEHNFVAKVPCRTVGVNVKIYRECDIVSASTPEQIQSYNAMMQNSSICGNSRVLQNQLTSPNKLLPVSKDRILGNSVEKFAQPVSNSSISTIPAVSSQQILQGAMQPMNPNTVVLPPGPSQQFLSQVKTLYNFKNSVNPVFLRYCKF